MSTRVLAATGIYTPSDVWLTTVMYYDDRYNVIQTVRNLYDLGGTSRERISRSLRFDGRLEKEFIVQEVATGNNSVEKFFTYDYADRPISTRYLVKKNSTNQKNITLSGSKYDALGQLKTKSLHSSANDGVYREQLDYCFTPRSWLSKVTGKTNGIENFGVQLKYNSPANGAVAQYNGNIAEMLWKRGNSWVGYKFTYDGPNRLVNGEGISGNTNRETISYDKNGNIITLQRAFDGVQKDNLSYIYNGNQLTSVTDAENNPEGFNNGNSGGGTDYLYDGNGNTTSDANRNISTNGILYSVHNLVQQVTISGGAILVYRYDGAGAKLRMENSNGAVNTKYAGAFEYDKNNYLTRIATEEGQIGITNNGATNNDYSFEYYLKDHLGNTRMVMNEAGTMTQETEYFPFGLAIPKIAGTNKYKFLGRENQPETGYMDLIKRSYDPIIGRFMQVDPVTELQESQSVYQYGWNNPILRSDPNGDYPDGPGDDPFLIARLVTTAFFDTKHAIINTAARAFNSDIRAGYKVDGDGNQTFETQISRQAIDNSLSGQVREAVSAVGDLALVATPGSSPGNPGNLLAKTNAESQIVKAIKETVELRHYTSNKGLEGIKKDMEIKAYDQNKVFAEKAKGKPLSAADAGTKYGIDKGSARNYVEFKVPFNNVNTIKNSRTGAVEYILNGNVKLDESAKFIKRN